CSDAWTERSSAPIAIFLARPCRSSTRNCRCTRTGDETNEFTIYNLELGIRVPGIDVLGWVRNSCLEKGVVSFAALAAQPAVARRAGGRCVDQYTTASARTGRRARRRGARPRLGRRARTGRRCPGGGRAPATVPRRGSRGTAWRRRETDCDPACRARCVRSPP